MWWHSTYLTLNWRQCHRIENILFIIRPWKTVCNVLQYCFLKIQLNICYVRLPFMCHLYSVKMLSCMWLIGVTALRPPGGAKRLIWSNTSSVAMLLVAITKSRFCHVFVTLHASNEILETVVDFGSICGSKPPHPKKILLTPHNKIFRTQHYIKCFNMMPIIDTVH